MSEPWIVLICTAAALAFVWFLVLLTEDGDE